MPLKLKLLTLATIYFSLKSMSIPSAYGDILFIGDSHVQGTFGRNLDQHLRDAPEFRHHRVKTIGVGGAIAQWYLEGTRSPWGFFSRNFNGEINEYEFPFTPVIEDLLSTLRPDSTVIIELGTNFLWGNNKQTLDSTTDQLISKITGANFQCIWVGPPPLGERFRSEIEGIDQSLKEVVTHTPCHWISSLALITYPDGPDTDHIHYDQAGPAGVVQAQLWASKVFSLLSIIKENGFL